MVVETVIQLSSSLEDPAEFRAFYADALPRVYGYHFLRCGADVGIAEDLTQETFLAAVTEIKRGRTITAPMPWIIGIARHKLLDHYRRQRRVGWSLLSLDDALDGEEIFYVEELEVPGENAIAALAAVSSPQREALVLRYLDGLSVPEVAAHLGRSVEAAESLLCRGRAGFKRAYFGAQDEN